MNTLIITVLGTDELIFTGVPDEFLEVNNYDDELEEILNMVMNGKQTTVTVSYDNENYTMEKVFEQIY